VLDGSEKSLNIIVLTHTILALFQMQAAGLHGELGKRKGKIVFFECSVPNFKNVT